MDTNSILASFLLAVSMGLATAPTAVAADNGTPNADNIAAAARAFAAADEAPPAIGAYLNDMPKNQPVSTVFFTGLLIANREQRPVTLTVTITMTGSIRPQFGPNPLQQTYLLLPGEGRRLSFPTIRYSFDTGRVDVKLRPRFYDSPQAKDWVRTNGISENRDGSVSRSFWNYHPTQSVQFSVFVDNQQRTKVVAPLSGGSIVIGNNGDYQNDGNYRDSLGRLPWGAEWAE